MMRKIICLMLTLVLSLSLACPALAAVNSPGSKPPASTPQTGDTIMPFVIMMVVALVALAAVALFSRKAFKKA